MTFENLVYKYTNSKQEYITAYSFQGADISTKRRRIKVTQDCWNLELGRYVPVNGCFQQIYTLFLLLIQYKIMTPYMWLEENLCNLICLSKKKQ